MSVPSLEADLAGLLSTTDGRGSADGTVHAAMQRLLAQEEAGQASLRPQVVRRGGVADAKRRLWETAARKIGVEEEYQGWLRAHQETSQQMIEASPTGQRGDVELGRAFTAPPIDRTITGIIGELWWARTDATFPAGYQVEFKPDGAHLFGNRIWSDGDLWKGSLQVLAKFVLDTNRMPGPGRFTSLPHCELFGKMTGATGWTWGDDWSKCWLHVAQFVNGGPAGARIAEGHDHRNVFFISDSERLEVHDLPGFIQFPRVDFNLDPHHPLIITLEIRLDFQMEGHSQIFFGSRAPGQPPVMRDALLRTFQWNLQRV
ncbi:hypothetical protein [Micromonospora sp. WMMD712]|uniref:hypothetical protein n=1 Tax=Micromonospora sp. WMMD712 TaxID=3016096 RepID=UPI00249A8477|nr:hypothetical protein [Micromonospora sp. WMMD712]WFE57657.1 hypothetical protein O7633_12660 [Micromonospora sp. WMMD712]